jgi:hypothetical protein
MARTKLTPYQLELRRQQSDGARTERLTQLNQRISYLAESSNRERIAYRTLALAQSLEHREKRHQATLISNDELDDEIDSLRPPTITGVFFGILLSLLFDLTQRIIANGV